jgi:hypothetical protein
MSIGIRGNWDMPSRSALQWLTDNPGSMILRRTIAAIICKRSADRRSFSAVHRRRGPRTFGS